MTGGGGREAWSAGEVTTAAAAQLSLAHTDADMTSLGQCAAAVVDLIGEHLAWTEAPTDVPAPIFRAATLATCDLYARKDARFGIVGGYTDDGTALRVSADWLVPVRHLLQPYRVRVGGLA